MTRLAILLAAGLCLGVRGGSAAEFALVRTVGNPTPAKGDFFAAALSAGAGTIVAGARFDDTGGADVGAAWVFDTASGAVRVTLASPDPAPGAQFGAAVAGPNDLVAVGAPHADSGAPHAGAVYLYDGASGSLVRRIPNPEPAAGALFGFSVAILDHHLVVGSPLRSDGTGAVSLFEGFTGELLSTYTNPVPGAYDLFGQAVATMGAKVLVGAPLDDGAAPNGGAAYLFSIRQRLVRTFTSPHPRAGDQFGAAVAALGDYVLVGAPFDDTAASDSGAVYLFDGVTGALLRTLVDPAANRDGRFGSAVAAAGSNVLVGAPFADIRETDDGVAYLFDGQTGTLLATFDNPTPAAGDQFGATVAASGDDVVIGAWLDDTGAQNSGTLYVFRDTAAPTTTTTTVVETSTTLVTPTTNTTTTATSTTSNTPTTTSGATTSTDTSTTATEPPPTTTTRAATTSTSATVPPVTAASTTSTATLATTTTTAAPVPPPDCDDGDPCTADVPIEGRCRHDAAAGYDGALCRLGVIDALLHEAPTAALGGRRVLRRLQRTMARAQRVVAAARAGRPDEARLVRRARRTLDAFMRAVGRAQRNGRMLRAFGERLTALAADASARLPAPARP